MPAEGTFELDEYPWPRENDDPFEVAGDWWNTACLTFQCDVPGRGYAHGFKLQADLAVEYVAAHRRDQNRRVFPILFVYRHYIEFTLKLIIRDARRLHNETDAPLPKNSRSHEGLERRAPPS